MKVLHVVGARPNFVKAAPLFRELQSHPDVRQSIVHTGQHYDANMSDVFFQQLRIPAPEINLQVGCATQAPQSAEIMSRLEPVLRQQSPDWVVVYGDVNSTLAAALVCAKLKIRVAHVEAGLRSFDRSMPEEMNRVLTDRVSDLLFTPSEDANRNLAREGICKTKIHFVGNVMIDTLALMLADAQQHLPAEIPDRCVLVTLHRPSNVDNLPWLQGMLATLQAISADLAVLFPVHPRTHRRILQTAHHLGNTNGKSHGGLRFLEPLPYLSFLALQQKASVVITDSGGVQEETTYLGTPCLTVRKNTERPVTVDVGTNILVGTDTPRIKREVETVLAGNSKQGSIPALWDGKASRRISEILLAGRRDILA